MRVMIAYDGSSYADAAIDNLPRAGLPHDSEVLIATVVDLSANKRTVSEFDLISAASRRVDAVLAQVRGYQAQLLSDARAMVSTVASSLRPHFPEWKTRFEVLRGTPVDELLKEAASWKPDLIIAGSHGRSAIGRFFLGSVSKRVAEEAHCSVRVVRPGVERNEAEPMELVIGAEKASDARRIVETVGKRVWNPHTRVRLVAVEHVGNASGISGVDVDGKSFYENVAAPLTAAGMRVSVEIQSGDTKSIWLEAAEGADVIFAAGNSSHESGLDAPALGLITGSKATVEIVRSVDK